MKIKPYGAIYCIFPQNALRLYKYVKDITHAPQMLIRLVYLFLRLFEGKFELVP